MTAVRTIMGQAQRRPWGMDARICSPCCPASRRAYGSWKSASERSLSMALYMATQRAVSETLEMGEIIAWKVKTSNERRQIRGVKSNASNERRRKRRLTKDV